MRNWWLVAGEGAKGVLNFNSNKIGSGGDRVTSFKSKKNLKGKKKKKQRKQKYSSSNIHHLLLTLFSSRLMDKKKKKKKIKNTQENQLS